jgi:hypothetical protein
VVSTIHRWSLIPIKFLIQRKQPKLDTWYDARFIILDTRVINIQFGDMQVVSKKEKDYRLQALGSILEYQSLNPRRKFSRYYKNIRICLHIYSNYMLILSEYRSSILSLYTDPHSYLSVLAVPILLLPFWHGTILGSSIPIPQSISLS